jgi:hypothetical protein
VDSLAAAGGSTASCVLLPEFDGVVPAVDSYATTKVQRKSQLTANAAPEPVKKGKTRTVTGKLSRANWNTHKYSGYSGQSVKLQYRQKNANCTC